MTDEHPGTEELAQHLEAYASARLSPRRGSAKTMRSSLVEDARMASLAERLSSQASHHRARRRLAVGLIAASLAFGGVAAVASASSPGGPLYGTRVWLETTTLPADPNARALERLHLIDARVLDLEEATRVGDPSAVAAAATAYHEAIDASLSEAGANDDQLDNLEAALQLHVGILQTISDRAPERAQGGLSRAIQASTKAVDDIRASRPGHVKNDTRPDGKTDTGPGGGKSPGSSGSPGASTNASPSRPPSR